MIFSSKNNNSLRLILLVVLLVGVAGCSNNMSELETYVADIKAKPPGDIPPIPEIKTYESFIYPGHERDPFDPETLIGDVEHIKTPEGVDRKVVKRRKGTVTVDTNRSKEYLEGFPLDSLSMVGTLHQKGQLWALIQTSDGTIQRVRKGNYMGKNYGKIEGITESEIKIGEKVPDRLGGYVKRPAGIAIKELTQ